MNLLNILLKKASNDQLAHFYILESSAPVEQSLDPLMKFTHQFIREYYQNIEGHKQSLSHLMDHPDVYVLGNLSEDDDKGSKPFTVAESEEFARFFEFRPVQGKRKFAVITEGHRISTVVANKWLKLFEEPQGVSTIFLLNPRRQKLLDTIHSRALHLRLPHLKDDGADGQSEWHGFLNEAKNLSLAGFLEKFSKGDRDLTFWTTELIRWETNQLDKIQAKSDLEKWVKNLQELETFHQPSATKWTLFYTYLQDHVLPRMRHD